MVTFSRGRQRKWIWALLGLTALGGALRFAALDAKTLWLDEVFSLWMARHALPELMTWLVQIDHHPPLYYALLHWWISAFGDSPSALRSLSAVASTLAIPLYGLGARKFAGEHLSIIAIFLLAISPFQVRYAQETRMYGLLMLVTALVFLAMVVVLTSDKRAGQVRWWVLLAVSEAAAMLTHNTATLLVPFAINGAMCGLLVARWALPWRRWPGEFFGMRQPHFVRNWVLSQLGAILVWSPWALTFLHQAQAVDGDFWIAAPDTWVVWTTLTSLTFAHLPIWVWQRDYLTWLAVALVLLGLWQGRGRAELTWTLLVFWLLPPVVELLVSLRRPVFYDRTLIWTTLPYYLLLARGMILPANVRKFWRHAWMTMSLGAVTLLCALGLWGYYVDFAKEEWDQVASFVAAQAKPGDIVLFHASWAELPFDYYYPKDAPGLLQHGIPADLFEAGVLEPPMTPADASRVKALIQGRDQVWLVYSHWWYTDPDGLLLRVLGEQMVIAAERDWPGIRVVRYRR